jgi:sulfofructose kinase
VAVEFDVICVGAANLDTIATVDRIPGDDERQTTNDFVNAGGGPAATAAVALARLGARVAMCGVIGDDESGSLVRSQLQAEGVSTEWLRTDSSASTARAFVLASRSTGARSIVTTLATEPAVDDIPVGRSRWLHVDQTGFANAAIALRRTSTQTRLSVDAGNAIQTPSLLGVDLYVPTVQAILARYETPDLEHAFRLAIADGAATVIATSGAAGTFVATPDGIIRVDAFAVDVVSTIGAGDVFHGSLLAGIVSGKSVVEATRFANASAALSCEGVDGRSRIPSRERVEAFLADPSARV